MWSDDGVVARQEHLDDFVVVVVSGEDQWSDVRRELRFLVRPEKRIFASPPIEFGVGHIVRMFNDHLKRPFDRSWP